MEAKSKSFVVASSCLRVALFAILIVLYEVFHITFYYLLRNSSPIYYFYTLFFGAIGFYVLGWLSDRYSKVLILGISILIAAIEFGLLLAGHSQLSILLSPIYASTPIAMAGIIEEAHRSHIVRFRSTKNAICLSYIALFIPWCFFRKIASPNFDLAFWLGLMFISILVLLPFLWIQNKHHKVKGLQKKETKKHAKLKRCTIFFLILSLFADQTGFYQVVEQAELNSFGSSFFELLGRGCLAATLLCWFSNGDHKHAVFTSFEFALIFSICSIFTFSYWGLEAWKVVLGLVGIFGGFYLPLITQQFVDIMGPKKRSQATAIVQSMIDMSSVLSFFILKAIFFIFHKPAAITSSFGVIIFFMLGLFSYKKFMFFDIRIKDRKGFDGK